MVKIAPSILTADFSQLKAELESISKADFIHLDVMDGHFVPNITFGPNVVKDIRKVTTISFDVHLMIENPDKYLARFREAGADYITFHKEATKEPKVLLQLIKSLNVKAGIAINPDTPVESIFDCLEYCDLVLVMSVFPGFGGQKFITEAVDKIGLLNKKRQEKGYNYLIEVDGGINENTAPLCIAKGVDIIVAGSYIFNRKDRNKVIEELKK